MADRAEVIKAFEKVKEYCEQNMTCANCPIGLKCGLAPEDWYIDESEVDDE